MGEQSPDTGQDSLNRFQMARAMGRRALRRWTTWSEYRRERRTSVSELHDLLGGGDALKQNVWATPWQARRFVMEWEAKDEEEDRPEMRPSETENQLLCALSDIIGRHEARIKVVDVAKIINQATMEVEGTWNAKGEAYQSGAQRQPDVAMVLARQALFEGLMLSIEDNNAEA